MRPTKILLASLVLAIAACGVGVNGETAGSTAQPTPSTTVATPTKESASSVNTPPQKAPDIDLTAVPDWFQNEDAAPESLVDTIAGELDAIYTGSMSVNWSTGGLGCETGGAELQVITPGYVIFYQGSDSLIRVHAGENGRWVVCGLGEPLRGTPVLNS